MQGVFYNKGSDDENDNDEERDKVDDMIREGSIGTGFDRRGESLKARPIQSVESLKSDSGVLLQKEKQIIIEEENVRSSTEKIIDDKEIISAERGHSQTIAKKSDSMKEDNLIEN